jgi:hypothetical protein
MRFFGVTLILLAAVSLTAAVILIRDHDPAVLWLSCIFSGISLLLNGAKFLKEAE